MKESSTTLTIKKIQINMSLRFHLTPVKMLTSRTQQQMLGSMQEKGTLIIVGGNVN
jgi:hypothetical protein